MNEIQMNPRVKATTPSNGATSNQQKAMEMTINEGRTLMWYVVDEDGWGKIYRFKPDRKDGIWRSHKWRNTPYEDEPERERLIPPFSAKKIGRTWKDEPCLVWMNYHYSINMKD